MELSKRVCKKCMRLHIRLYSGQKGKNSIWRDEHGLRWNGKICGGCNRDRIREAVAETRKKKSAEQHGSSGSN